MLFHGVNQDMPELSLNVPAIPPTKLLILLPEIPRAYYSVRIYSMRT